MLGSVRDVLEPLATVNGHAYIVDQPLKSGPLDGAPKVSY
jgi:hypothetical protein